MFLCQACMHARLNGCGPGFQGYGVIGGGGDGPNEIEGEPGFSLTLGQLPGVDVHVLQTLRSSIPEPGSSMQDWSDFVGVPFDTPKEVSFMILADPRFTQVRSASRSSQTRGSCR